MDWFQKKTAVVAVMVVVTFMIMEFVILSTVGTIGPKVSSVRKEREQIKLENEIKLAKIRELQTSERVVESVDKDLGMQQQEIKTLQATTEFSGDLAYGL